MVNKTALILSFLAVITLGGVSNKLSYQIEDVGDPRYPPHFFKKPWFLELLMFSGMILSFPVYWAIERSSGASKVQVDGAGAPLLEKDDEGRGWKVRAMIFLPAMGDLVGSILSFTGLVYISNSTAQMLGSSIIVMVACNSYLFLGRRYNKIQCAGMATVLGSLVLIGWAASISADAGGADLNEASPSEQMFGMFLCVAARAVNSIQFVLEEKVMSESKLHPLEVVGTEGLYGWLVTACVMMPILAYIPGGDVGGVYEDTVDSVMMVGRNRTLDCVLVLYLLGLWGLNALGMMVMKHLGAVFRSVSRNLQALFVWLIDMALFYGLGPNGFGYGPVGEPWKGLGSWIQVLGFVFMSVGVFVYAYGNAVQQVQAAQQEDELHPSPVPVSRSMRKLATKVDGLPSPMQVVRAELANDEEDSFDGLPSKAGSWLSVTGLDDDGSPGGRRRARAGSTAEYVAL